MTRSLLLASILAGAASSLPLTETNITPRAVINHDAVVGFPETVPDSIIGQMYLAYKPYLYVRNGCVPFPAVDADGNTSGGLSPTGPSNGDCASHTGQIYARSTMTDGTSTTTGNHAIMYSWYFPKDSPSTELGHRHEWEGVIVWLRDGASTSADNVLAVCPSAHGDWNCSTDGFTLHDGTHPLISYYSVWPVNHQLWLTGTVGGMQPLIAWESLTEAARGALQRVDFGDATVPFKDSTFTGNLDSATF